MANTSVECPRRVSYAGSTANLEQKSRRVSYAGHSGINELANNISGKIQSDLLANNPVNHRASLATIAAAAASEQQQYHQQQLSTPALATSNSSGIQNKYSVTAMLDGIIVSRGMDSNRNSRRSTRNSDDGFNCSQQSILSAMDRFVKSVNNMDQTVLIPSRLRDMDFDSNAVKSRPPLGLNNPDLYSFYNMLKDVKTELLWGSAMGATSSMLGPLSAVSGRSTPHRSHTRQPSDDSLGSTGSASDQDTDSDIDSVLTDRDSCSMDEQTSHIAVAFRYHLQGLHTILHQLADSADYLAARYQAEVDSSPL